MAIWSETAANWNTTNIIWAVGGIIVSKKGGHSNGGVNSKGREYKEHFITVTVEVFNKKFSVTKTKREYINAGATNIAERIIENLKPNIKIKIGKK